MLIVDIISELLVRVSPGVAHKTKMEHEMSSGME